MLQPGILYDLKQLASIRICEVTDDKDVKFGEVIESALTESTSRYCSCCHWLAIEEVQPAIPPPEGFHNVVELYEFLDIFNKMIWMNVVTIRNLIRNKMEFQ